MRLATPSSQRVPSPRALHPPGFSTRVQRDGILQGRELALGPSLDPERGKPYLSQACSRLLLLHFLQRDQPESSMSKPVYTMIGDSTGLGQKSKANGLT